MNDASLVTHGAPTLFTRIAQRGVQDIHRYIRMTYQQCRPTATLRVSEFDDPVVETGV
jgi:hypothetical protein